MKNSRGESATQPQNTTAGTQDPVQSGVRGTDESTRDYREPARKTPQEGNRVPDVNCRNEGPI